MSWNDSAIRRAARDWVWLPEWAPQVVTDEFTVVAYPDHFAEPTQVTRLQSDRQVTQLADDITAAVRSLGRESAAWWVDDDTVPTGLEAWLRNSAGDPKETVSVLAFDMGTHTAELAVPAAVATSLVQDEDGLRQWLTVDHQAWGAPVPSDVDFQTQLDRLEVDLRDGELRVLAHVDGQPVGMGGCTISDGVARLWGAATVPAQRHRGAYRAVLHERMRLGRGRGATLALVKGRVTTSAPILRRAGFRSMGEERAYLVTTG